MALEAAEKVILRATALEGWWFCGSYGIDEEVAQELLAVEVLKGHGFKPCRESLKSDVQCG